MLKWIFETAKIIIFLSILALYFLKCNVIIWMQVNLLYKELQNMRYTKTEFEKHVKSWESFLEEYSIPSWEELPPLDLYMDQIIVLMNRYLKTFTLTDDESSALITPPMINNYVKLKAMPAPQKKKYSKTHLAYLIMISSLKHALSLPTISRLIPLSDNEDEVKKLYEDFAINQKKAFSYIKEHVTSVTNSVLNSVPQDELITTGIAVQLATSANIFKILSDDAANISENLQQNEKAEK